MMKNRAFSLLKLAACLPVFWLVSACDTANDSSIANKSVIYCSEGSPESFNPQLETSGTTIDATSKQLYDRLVAFDPDDNSLVPSIAKSWHVTQDGKMVTFYLRKDVTFHQTDYFTPTRTLNADDVLFSFERILDTDHPYHRVSGGRYPFFQSVKFSELVEDIEKINEHTIRFHLHRADASFLTNLATDFAVILSQEYASQLATQDNRQQIDIAPIGTGPFKLKEFRPGNLIRYNTHPEYWQHSVNIEQLVYDITPRKNSRLNKLLAGECDIIAYPIAHNEIKAQPNLKLDAVTVFNVGYLGFNTQKPPFDQQIVRKAISYAINKQAIIEAIYFGQAEPASSILPKNSWAATHSGSTPFSINMAKSMLREAGYPDGFDMDLWAMPVQRAYNPNAVKMAKLIQADLAKINVKVNIISYEWSIFLRRLANSEHQAVLLGWSADHPDPDNFFSPLLSCASAETGNNRTFWCNNEFDQLIQQALLTDNIEQRKRKYSKALEIIAEEVPLIPIAHSQRFQARSIKIQGKLLHPFGGIDFSQVSKQPVKDTPEVTEE